MGHEGCHPMIVVDLSSARDFTERWRRELAMGAVALLVASLLASALIWWFMIRWKPPPSIFDNPVDDALGYLALPDFNKLSVEERMKFLMELADRFRGLEPGESAAAAAFLAGIVGPAREQLHENARQLAKDVLAGAAARFMELPEAERGPFIDAWLADWIRMGERLTRGEERKRTDDERLEAAKGDVQRNRERVTEMGGAPTLTDRSAGQFLDFWQSEVEKSASPREQGQIVFFMNAVRNRLTR